MSNTDALFASLIDECITHLYSGGDAIDLIKKVESGELGKLAPITKFALIACIGSLEYLCHSGYIIKRHSTRRRRIVTRLKDGRMKTGVK